MKTKAVLQAISKTWPTSGEEATSLQLQQNRRSLPSTSSSYTG
jgi:hypothetical protein